MTAAAHVTVSAAIGAATGWHPASLPLAMLLHGTIDTWGAYHPPDILKADTWQKRVLLWANFVTLAALILACYAHRDYRPLAWGLAGWLWADIWWAIREFWPSMDRFNPHRLWWVKGDEFREWMPAFWLELALMAAGVVCI